MKKENIIYMAGILDGEGCISILRTPRKYGYKSNCSYAVRVTISNTSKELIDWLQNRFDGYFTKPRNMKNRKIIYNWVLHGPKTLILLKMLYPYLIIKKERANVAIDFLNKKIPNKPLSNKQRIEQERAYLHMKKLNKRGI